MKTLVAALLVHALLRESVLSFRPSVVGRVGPRTRRSSSSPSPSSSGAAVSAVVARSRGRGRHISRSHSLTMHMGHSHAHHDHAHEDDDHDHDHTHAHEVEPSLRRTAANLPFSLWGQLLNPQSTLLQKRSGKVLLAALIVVIPAFVRKSFTRLDVAAFGVISAVLLVFDGLRFATKKWISKVKMFQEGLVKHSTPLTRQYFFKNENAADRITLLGVYINVVLSVVKFCGGLMFNSAVLVADAGHSLSDLFSDFITLWAVQIARLPPDEDHPFGHGKFESVGSLFLSLTLLATGLSVGTWSYEKLREVLTAQQALASVGTKAAAVGKGAAAAVAAAATAAVKLPSWPALGLAAFSIGSKEWLFQVTRRVGEALNSQILVANAWHHRSDAFSSVLSLLSIALAIFVPGLLVADSAAGILVAGMICITGMEILFESVKQLTDTSDTRMAKRVQVVATDVEGVLGVANVRARTVGSGSLVDLTVLTDVKISASAAHAIGERARWRVLESLPYVSDVLVRTRSTETVCPLLSRNQRDPASVERDVRAVVSSYEEVHEVKKVTVHYVNTATLCTEIVIKVAPGATVREAEALAARLQARVKEDSDIVQAEVHLCIGDDALASPPQLGKRDGIAAAAAAAPALP